MDIGKDTSKPFIFNDSPLTEVNTFGSDENSMKLNAYLMYTCHYYNQDLLLVITRKQPRGIIFGWGRGFRTGTERNSGWRAYT